MLCWFTNLKYFYKCRKLDVRGAFGYLTQSLVNVV
jgi:hypothetical protein